MAERSIQISREAQRWRGLPEGVRSLRTLEQLAQAGFCRFSFDDTRQCIIFTITPQGRRAARKEQGAVHTRP